MKAEPRVVPVVTAKLADFIIANRRIALERAREFTNLVFAQHATNISSQGFWVAAILYNILADNKHEPTPTRLDSENPAQQWRLASYFYARSLSRTAAGFCAKKFAELDFDAAVADYRQAFATQENRINDLYYSKLKDSFVKLQRWDEVQQRLGIATAAAATASTTNTTPTTTATANTPAVPRSVLRAYDGAMAILNLQQRDPIPASSGAVTPTTTTPPITTTPINITPITTANTPIRAMSPVLHLYNSTRDEEITVAQQNPIPAATGATVTTTSVPSTQQQTSNTGASTKKRYTHNPYKRA